MIKFNDFINNYVIHYDIFINNKRDALNKLYSDIYKIVVYKDKIYLKKGIKSILNNTDYITNFSESNDIYYYINDVEFKLTTDTDFIIFLSPLNPIYILYDGDKDSITLTYDNYCINPKLSESLIYKHVKSNKHRYQYGEMMPL